MKSTATEPASTVEPTTSVKSSTATTMAAALGECRRRRTKNHERKNCNENYRQGLLHFSPSDPTTRDGRAGTNFRRRHLRWQPTYRPILHPRRASNHPPNANRDKRIQVDGKQLALTFGYGRNLLKAEKLVGGGNVARDLRAQFFGAG
jgi:hypothetical protein